MTTPSQTNLPRFEIEFVQKMLETAVKRLGINDAKIQRKVCDHEGEMDLHEISVAGGFLHFSICEVVVMKPREGAALAGPDKAIGYQACFWREIPARGMTPPDVAEHQLEAIDSPIQAIENAIVFCLRETVQNACTDEMMYKDWQEEQEDKG